MPDDHCDRPALSAAGGGVVWRVTEGRVEIALVHRPRYDDWSLPKGKAERDEPVLATAVREVGEELGSAVLVGPWLGQVEYPTHRGGVRVIKCVDYWSMRHVGGGFVPNHEVDDVAWVPPGAAARLLTYRRDRQVVKRYTDAARHDRSVVLVRHARAGKRREWRGDDTHRPLDSIGAAQAGRLGRLLARLAPAAVYSADRARCVQTVEPLARRAGLEVIVDPTYSDESYAADPTRTEKALLSSAEPLATVVVCSQGEAIPGLIGSLRHEIEDASTRKAAFWLLSFDGDRCVAADRYEA